MNIKFSALVLLLLAACEPAISTERADCLASSGDTVPSSYAENPANADFGTNISLPANGDNFASSCTLADTTVGELADRTQWLKGWLATAPSIRVNMAANYSAGFTVSGSSPGYWTQNEVTDTGLLVFSLPALPVGRKITAVTATVNNSLGSALPATMPNIELDYTDTASGGSTGTLISAASDPTAVLATYQAKHDFGITGLSHTINANYEYGIAFRGETSTNSHTGLHLYRIVVTLGY